MGQKMALVLQGLKGKIEIKLFFFIQAAKIATDQFLVLRNFMD
jgi:hypothetical protein